MDAPLHGVRPPAFNPMAGNPLRTRGDVARALRDLSAPLDAYRSPGAARVRLDMAAASFDRAAAELEGFARPLWGLAPLAVGGGDDFVDWTMFSRGLANGCDPAHPEFWGWPTHRDQRLVELAALGFALALLPQRLWQPQSATAKADIAAYLQHAYRLEFGSNNWMFFRVMIGLGLQALGQDIDAAPTDEYLRRLDALSLGGGWYRDGPFRRADHYVPFALQYYALLYCRLGRDPQRKALYRQRAEQFAPDFARWFAPDGAVLPFGRSLTYRFACGAFWAGAALADVPVLPWGQVKGLALRHLRWWSQQPIAHRDGVLSIGYAYPNLHLCEPYNSAASPYWAFKAFGFMALPEGHPFWTSPEEPLPLPAPAAPSTQRQPGMVIFNPPGDVVALAAGQQEQQRWLRLAPEKYCKFAYSARYAFSVETDFRCFDAGSFDSMLAFSDDGVHFHVREGNHAVRIADGLIHARWSPAPGIEVETWLLPAAPWHLRLHRIVSDRHCQTIEGGFAVARPDGNPGDPGCRVEEGDGMACIGTPADLSGLRDGGSTIARSGRVLEALPNANLVHARSSVPQLLGSIAPGRTLLMTAVLAAGASAAVRQAWQHPPAVPAIDSLQRRLAEHGSAVAVFE